MPDFCWGVLIVIGIIIFIVYQMGNCSACDGSGRSKTRIKHPDDTTTVIDKGPCPKCGGSGRR